MPPPDTPAGRGLDDARRAAAWALRGEAGGPSPGPAEACAGLGTPLTAARLGIPPAVLRAQIGPREPPSALGKGLVVGVVPAGEIHGVLGRSQRLGLPEAADEAPPRDGGQPGEQARLAGIREGEARAVPLLPPRPVELSAAGREAARGEAAASASEQLVRLLLAGVPAPLRAHLPVPLPGLAASLRGGSLLRYHAVAEVARMVRLPGDPLPAARQSQGVSRREVREALEDLRAAGLVGPALTLADAEGLVEGLPLPAWGSPDPERAADAVAFGRAHRGALERFERELGEERAALEAEFRRRLAYERDLAAVVASRTAELRRADPGHLGADTPVRLGDPAGRHGPASLPGAARPPSTYSEVGRVDPSALVTRLGGAGGGARDTREVDAFAAGSPARAGAAGAMAGIGFFWHPCAQVSPPLPRTLDEGLLEAGLSVDPVPAGAVPPCAAYEEMAASGPLREGDGGSCAAIVGATVRLRMPLLERIDLALALLQRPQLAPRAAALLPAVADVALRAEGASAALGSGAGPARAREAAAAAQELRGLATAALQEGLRVALGGAPLDELAASLARAAREVPGA